MSVLASKQSSVSYPVSIEITEEVIEKAVLAYLADFNINGQLYQPVSATPIWSKRIWQVSLKAPEEDQESS